MEASYRGTTQHMFIDPLLTSTNKVHNNISNGTAHNEGDLKNSETSTKANKPRSKPSTNSSGHSYQKVLEDWLDNCTTADPPNMSMQPQSLEFSDKHQSLHHQQQQQQQQHPQQPQQQHQQQHHHYQQYQHPQQHSGNMNPSTPTINTYKTSFTPYLMRPNVPDISNYSKHYSAYQFCQPNYVTPFSTPHHLSNNIMQNLNHSDFTSLPPTVNINNSNSNNINNNSDDKTSNPQDLLDVLDGRRYSDPCLAATNSDNESKTSGINSQKVESIKNSKDEIIDNRLLKTLLDQINLLHETNSKICRNLHETKVEIEALKHAPSWGLRHRRDSISGLSTHSQPLGYAFGAVSPAPTFHSGMYTPGMLTDVVREVKEAARIREEALLSRVRGLVEERSWSINETNLKVIRDLEEIKIQLQHFKIDKNETNIRITKLEDEIKSLRTLVSHALNYNRPSNSTLLNHSNSFNERDFKARNYSANIDSHRKKRNSLNLNYGTISQHELDNDYLLNEDDIVRPMNQQFNDIRKAEKFKYSQNGGGGGGGGGGSGGGGLKHNNNSNNYSYTDNHNDRIFNSEQLYQTQSSIGNSNERNDGHIVQMEKDTLELRRELQDALANKKNAEHKILALENIVKNLQNKIPTSNNQALSVGGGANSSIINVSGSGTNNSNNSNNSKSSRQINTENSSTLTSSTAPSSISQVASQIQTISPKLLTSNTICLTGPVTDL